MSGFLGTFSGVNKETAQRGRFFQSEPKSPSAIATIAIAMAVITAISRSVAVVVVPLRRAVAIVVAAIGQCQRCDPDRRRSQYRDTGFHHRTGISIVVVGSGAANTAHQDAASR